MPQFKKIRRSRHPKMAITTRPPKRVASSLHQLPTCPTLIKCSPSRRAGVQLQMMQKWQMDNLEHNWEVGLETLLQTLAERDSWRDCFWVRLQTLRSLSFDSTLITLNPSSWHTVAWLTWSPSMVATLGEDWPTAELAAVEAGHRDSHAEVVQLMTRPDVLDPLVLEEEKPCDGLRIVGEQPLDFADGRLVGVQ